MGQIYQLTEDKDELLSEAERAFDVSVRMSQTGANQPARRHVQGEEHDALPPRQGLFSSLPWVGSRFHS